MPNTSATDTSLPGNEEVHESHSGGDSIIISGPTPTLPDRLNELLGDHLANFVKINPPGPHHGRMAGLALKQTAKRQFGKEKS